MSIGFKFQDGSVLNAIPDIQVGPGGGEFNVSSCILFLAMDGETLNSDFNKVDVSGNIWSINNMYFTITSSSGASIFRTTLYNNSFVCFNEDNSQPGRAYISTYVTNSYNYSNANTGLFILGKSSSGAFRSLDSLLFNAADNNKMYEYRNVVNGEVYGDCEVGILLTDNTFGISIKGGSLLDLSKFGDSVINVDNPVGPPKPKDPYPPIDPSGPEGGGGNFDDSSDPITDSPLPTLSCADTGFTRIYNPTLSQLQDLARYLWTDESILQTIWNRVKQFFENPMSAIISLSIVPVAVPDGGVEDFTLMYFSTGVNMNTAANQFVDVDCGTLNISEYYGSALDYSPNTKITCYLPFIGNVQLNVDEVMGTTLQVKYRVDIVSGACVAKIAVNGNFLYEYTGHCAIYIPVTAGDFSTYQAALIGIAKTALTAVGAAMGGGSGSIISSLVGGGNPRQQTSHSVVSTENRTTERNPATGRQITMGTASTTKSTDQVITTQASFSGLTASNISNTVGQVIGSKPTVEHSGSFTGNSGYLGVRYPFVTIERPRVCRPDNYQSLNGFPCMITLKLSSCSGYTQVQQVQLTNIPCTNPESAEILELLKSGVII